MSKTTFAKGQLKSFIERIERLEEEKAALVADVREVYAEAKGEGFDTKIMRQIVRLRKLDKADFQEWEAMLDLYLEALDMRARSPAEDRDPPALIRLSMAKADKSQPAEAVS